MPVEKLSILGGEAIRSEPYPRWPIVEAGDIEAVIRVLKSGNWCTASRPSPESDTLIRRFEALQGGGQAVLIANGSLTMEVALRAADIGWQDEVIVPAYTFQATAAAPINAGAIPVIVDIDPETYCIDPSKIEEALTPRTRAIIVVHLGANIADMERVMDLAENHNLIVIEDACHSIGAKWRGRGTGTIGHFGSFSFQETKTLSSGEGGILLCRTSQLAERAASISNCGRPSGPENPSFHFGFNYRMTEIQAAIVNAALDRFPDQAKERQELLRYLEEKLEQEPGIRLLKHDPDHNPRSFWRYIFAMDTDIFGVNNDVFCSALAAEGIPCWVGYEAMHRYKLFQPLLSKLPVPSAFPERFDFSTMKLPEAERACGAEAIWLEEPIFRSDRRGIDDVIRAIRKVRENASELKSVPPAKKYGFI